ncbi:hypothetical protein D9757_000249 [Collybiopsis confluens]|uniref:NADH dehydrogenase (Ubiquinone) complex I, assembly factor 6 n=1 Tax=Collybiopsis confluens TaxID=2823264 RepID=A0A8H5MGQ3_9AGAR|nr:hypothetical protein D9757_000249 [Collybiopsis confluens]
MLRVAQARRLLLSRSLSTFAKNHTDPITYCVDLVKKHDYESYLIAHFWPKELRGGYFALKAFSTEIASIQDNVSNTSIGRMRMQFWRDAVKGIADGNPPRHPIALALYQEPSIQNANLQMYHFKRIIDARDAELQVPVHLTVDSLTAHSESTSSTMLYLLLSLRQPHSRPKLGSLDLLSHALSHLGTAHTMSILLRALPYHARNGRMVIPAEITAKHSVVQEDVFRKGPGATGLADAVFEFATIANDHLRTAQEMFEDGNSHDHTHSHGHEREGLGNGGKDVSFGGKIPRAVMPVFLTGIPVSTILTQLEKVNFNVFDPRIQVGDWKLPWSIWKRWYKRRMY